MKLSDFLNRIGYSPLITYNIYWNIENNEEVMISTDLIDAVIDLFSDYYLYDEDSICISAKKDKIIVDLYIYKPEN